MRPTPNHVHVAKVIRWHDGDTVKLDLDLDYETHNDGWHRLIGIDTPELWEPGGKDALAYVERMAPPGTALVLISYKAKNLIPMGGAKEKYGRWLAELWVEEGSGSLPSINKALVLNGHATVYSGGAR